MLSIDSETNGVDHFHGTQPYLVTTCNDNGDQAWWEWDVNPLTREVQVIYSDLEEIADAIASSDYLVLQNAKFDAQALATLGLDFPWHKTYDTLIAGHLLASNQPHNLTDMALHYLGADIQPYEDSVEQAVKECRRMVQQARLRIQRRAKKAEVTEEPDSTVVTATKRKTAAKSKKPPIDPRLDKMAEWRIADEGLEEMPSAGGSIWKADMWLPRAVARHLGYPEDHPYWTVTSEYANTDSSTTALLWKAMEREIRKRGLWEIYVERMKLPRIAYAMEARGVTYSHTRLCEQRREYTEQAQNLANTCVSIAEGNGYDLQMPKGSSSNKSLLNYLFENRDFYNRYALQAGPAMAKSLRSDKTGKPSLDKAALEYYEAVTEEKSDDHAFVRALRELRKRTTAVTYMDSYERFGLPLRDVDGNEIGEWIVLHPNLHITGTDTLRWSSTNPNEQNISEREGFNVRYCFGPAPGREWYSMDAKGIEDRLPAYESEERELIDIFERSTEPPYYGSNHLLRFHTVYSDIWEAELGTVCKVENCCKGKVVDISRIGPHCKSKYAYTYYKWAKNGGFAKQYGGQKAKVDSTFRRKGASELLDARFAKLAALNQYWIRFAEKYGYVETMPDRTVNPKKGYPVMCTRTSSGKVLPTVPLNYHIQSTAMWWMMKAMIRCHEQLELWRLDGFDAYIVMQVHDELVFDFPKAAHPLEDPENSNLWRVRVLQELMMKGGDDIGIPTPVSVEWHPENWSEGISL